MRQLSTAADVQAFRLEGAGSLALVPTMGNLHDGHLALVKQAQTLADRVVVSIFVNPTQFGPNEDYERYPRTLEADLAKLQPLAVDAVFTPSVEVLYPSVAKPFRIEPPAALANRLCGASRPGHFDGVCQVVLKLFNFFQPTVAIFGEKDYQQLTIIRAMVQDLCLPLGIVGAPIQRDAQGLALSSRNQYLSDEQRQTALGLSRLLTAIQDNHQFDEATQQRIQTELTRFKSLSIEWDYIEAVCPDTLQPVSHFNQPARLLVAAKVGSVRLIDNRLINPAV